jgi:hypothetical protein
LFPVPVELDGRPLALLGFGTYTRVELRPGRYTLSPPNTAATRAVFGIPRPVELTVEAGKAYFLLPTRSVEDVRPTVAVAGNFVYPSQTGTSYGSFSVQAQPAQAAPPPGFQGLSYVAPDAAFL